MNAIKQQLSELGHGLDDNPKLRERLHAREGFCDASHEINKEAGHTEKAVKHQAALHQEYAWKHEFHQQVSLDSVAQYLPNTGHHAKQANMAIARLKESAYSSLRKMIDAILKDNEINATRKSSLHLDQADRPVRYEVTEKRHTSEKSAEQVTEMLPETHRPAFVAINNALGSMGKGFSSFIGQGVRVKPSPESLISPNQKLEQVERFLTPVREAASALATRFENERVEPEPRYRGREHHESASMAVSPAIADSSGQNPSPVQGHGK